MRFEWRFAIAAIIANLHDVIIILGFFAFFQWEFSLPVLAAVLAVLGYSVNESVVIADRIRENFRKMRKATVTHVIDNAITSTISRTIITHGSTLMMVLSILFFGGETLHYFALALTIGICFGIYSSVLVMAPLVMWMGVSREDLVKPETQARRTRGREDPAVGQRARGRFPARRQPRPAAITQTPSLTRFSHADDALLLAVRAGPDGRAARRPARPLALRGPVPDHLRRDGARRASRSCPATRSCSSPGTVVATADLNVHLLVIVLIAAAILGDTVNYSIGHYIGPRVVRQARFALVQAGAPAPHAGVLRPLRRRSRSSSAGSCRSSGRSRRSSPAWPE